MGENFNPRKESRATDRVPELASTLEELKARAARIEQPVDSVQDEVITDITRTPEQEEDLSDFVQTLLKNK